MLRVRLATELGAMLPRLAVCVALGATFASAVGGRPPDAAGLVLAAPSLLLAVTANLVAQHAFAAAAFWVRDAKGTWFLYQKLVFVLGGMLLPLEVLPGGLLAVAKALPFMAMSYAPARLASGHVEPELLAIQAFWVVVLWLAAVRLFGAGERRVLELGA
jgi:ABC-2 type transport system permease protein